MRFTEQDIQKTLLELGLPSEMLEQTTKKIIEIQQRLAPAMQEFEQKKLARHLVIAQDTKAIQFIESITDLLIEKEDLITLAKQGKDIHDRVAIIRATITTLIAEEEYEASTIQKLQRETQRLSKVTPENPNKNP